ncbi:MAG: Hsp20/alpha crystallin family protein [Saprospiraceae bacterium]|nr:Hsp20/alpha crystallin family protein [Saprospiraceae bacterium]
MNLIKVNSFLPVHAQMSDAIEVLLNRSVAEIVGSDVVNGLPRANVIEKEDAFQIDLAVPGFERSDFKVDVDKDLLTVKVEKDDGRTDEAKRLSWKRREFSYTSFTREFKLDKQMNREGIMAHYENGILSLQIPKEIKEATRAIEVL